VTLSETLREYVAAAFTGIWVQSYEHADALTEIARLCKEQAWSLAVWDVDRGLQSGGGETATAGDPLAAVKSAAALATTNGSGLLVLPNFHRFLNSIELVQSLAHQIELGKQNRTFVIVLSPVVQIPVELEKAFVVIEHELPDRAQLEQIARGIATEERELPGGEELAKLIDAAAGLTRFEAEGAFSLSLVRHARLQPQSIWELKSGMLKKAGLLQLHRGGESFSDLGGMDAIKSFCVRSLRRGRAGRARARGILLLGVPGTGKSAFAEALGNETGRPTVLMDVGALLGSLVGQSEHNVRQALRMVDAMSPAILFVDEIEKALSGVASSGQTDSGVSARLFGSLLTWLSDHTSDVYFVGTCNDITKLPPEFSRAERFDGIFFCDTPGTAEKQSIWPIHLQRYGVDVAGEKLPDAHEWTGAEIQSCCRLASLLNVSLRDAARNVVPVAVTAAESVDRLRSWTAGRCLDASSPGIYTRGSKGDAATATGRRVARPGSN
jgi:hypothetical protein